MDRGMDNSAGYPRSSENNLPLNEQERPRTGPVLEQTKAAASRVADQAVQQVKSQLEAGKEKATGSLQGVAEALQETGDSFREKNQDALGRYAETGAEMVEQISGYFRDRSVDQIVNDAEGMARRQTGLFLGGAFAIGFILTRFLKSTSPTGYWSDNGNRYTPSKSVLQPTGSTPPSTAGLVSSPPSSTAVPAAPGNPQYPGNAPASGR